MIKNIDSINKLIDSFSLLPGVGNKTAERLAFSILNMDEKEVREFSQNLIDIKTNINTCPICGMLKDSKSECSFCNDEDRVNSILIVVATSKDALAIESLEHKYKFHVLGGEINMLKDITPDKLRISSLIERIDSENVKEIILATNPTANGELTAKYIAKILSGKDINISRLATGIPVGGEIDYLDSLTIENALYGRKKIN